MAEREVRIYETLYQDYMNDLETAYREPPRRSEVRLISEALPPPNPSSPRYLVVLAISIMLGLIAGLGLALTREWELSAAPEPDAVRTGPRVRPAEPDLTRLASVRGDHPAASPPQRPAERS